jgi:CRP/FNR family transcriptional regulator, cyclic AMP receptor protein
MTITEACQVPKVFQNVNQTTRAKLVPYGMLRPYKKGEVIFRDQEEVNRFYFVISGFITLYKVNMKQSQKVIFIYGSGEMLNEVLIDRPKASINCEALSDVITLSYSRKQLLEMMEQDFELTLAVMKSSVKKTRRLYRQLANTSNVVRVDCQVASKLWKLAFDYGEATEEGVKIKFELSISFLADMVGSKRETVSRIVNRLCKEGLLKTRRNVFIILNMNGLRDYSKK